MSTEPIIDREANVTDVNPAPEMELSHEILNVPNALTLFRIFLVPLLVVVILTKFEGKEYVALGIFLLASITDWLDGFIARRLRKVTRVGMLLDPIADKLLICSALVSLVEMGIAPAWMVVIIIGREFAVEGLRSIASQRGVTIAASGLGKTKTVSQVVAVALLILGHKLNHVLLTPLGIDRAIDPEVIGKFALWVVVTFALVSGVDYFMKFSKAVFRE